MYVSRTASTPSRSSATPGGPAQGRPANPWQYRGRVSRKGLAGILKVFHEYLLQFEGYLLSGAQMPGPKESDPDPIYGLYLRSEGRSFTPLGGARRIKKWTA